MVEKRALSWDETKAWVKQNPYLTGAAAAGLGGGVSVARHVLKKAKPASSKVQARLRSLAKKEGLSFATEKSIKGKTPTLWENIKGRLALGGAKPIHSDQLGYATGGKVRGGRQQFKGVTVGLDPSATSKAEIHMGGGATTGKKARKLVDRMERIDKRGKPFEQGKELGLEKFFPKGSGLDIVHKKYKIKRPPKGASVPQQQAYLNKLQGALKKEYSSQGFVLKPHDLVASSGAFPGAKGNWGKIHQDYLTRLKPKMDALAADYKKNPKKYGSKSLENVMAEKFRKDPAYVATAFESAFKAPAKTLVQERANLVRFGRAGGRQPAEFRVHVVGGQAAPELAYVRHSPAAAVASRIPLVGRLFRGKRLGSAEDAAAWVQKNVMPGMNKKYKGGTYGMDVVRVKKPGGGYGYKLIELNPSAPSGMSGFLSGTMNPLMPHDVHKYVYGKSSPLMAGLRAAGTGAVAGAAATGGALALRGKGGAAAPTAPAKISPRQRAAMQARAG